MQFLTRLTALALITAHNSLSAAAVPQALVYRGPAACDGCPEALAHLLRTAPSKFNVSYVGPDEAIKLTSASLAQVDLYAQPGGGGISRTWPHMKPHYAQVRDFVSSGGLYLGTCLGAYFAGTPGFDLLGAHRNTNEEATQPGSQVDNRTNTVIQVDWHFAAGELAGTTERNRWLFFQDGTVIAPHRGVVPNATVLARYSQTGDLAALVKGFGKGRIGIVGPHPEARLSWYTPYDLQNPDGINFKYGWDLVEALLHGPKTGAKPAASTSKPNAQPASSKPSAAMRSVNVSRGISLLCFVALASLIVFIAGLI